jgi:hypothetical protein
MSLIYFSFITALARTSPEMLNRSSDRVYIDFRGSFQSFTSQSHIVGDGYQVSYIQVFIKLHFPLYYINKMYLINRISCAKICDRYGINPVQSWKCFLRYFIMWNKMNAEGQITLPRPADLKFGSFVSR